MADSVAVKIDIAKVIENLSAAEGITLTAPEVGEWLQSVGFIPTAAGWWICEEISLDALHRSEIEAVKRAD